MKNSCLCTLVVTLIFGVSSVARSDVVLLKHGAKLEGRIVNRTEASVEIDIGAGSLTIPMSSVDSIEMGRAPLHDYEDRATELDARDREGWMELARWSSAQGLGTQSLDAYARVLALDPDDPEANRALGRVAVDGVWMTAEQANSARGYVNFEGEWVTPEERQSIVRAREAEAVATAQVQAAEAQARAAEARAQEAEERSRRSYRSSLYWNSWGPGPRAWPSNPLDHGRFERGKEQGQP